MKSLLSPFRRRTPLPALGILALLVLLTGCVQVTRPPAFENVDHHIGGTLPDTAWQAAEADGGARPLVREKTAVWLLPMHLFLGETRIDRESSTALSLKMWWTDLAPVPLVVLPLRIAYSTDFYEKGNPEPVGRRGCTVWLLWARDYNDGKTDNAYLLRSRGIPLLYSKTSVTIPESARVHAWNVLWSLGPFSMKAVVDHEDHDTSAYFTTPLLLGGLPGALLWSDYGIRSSPESLLTGHGPAFGALGYFAYRGSHDEAANGEEPPPAERATDRESRHLLVLGLLWSDYARRTAEGRTLKAVYGPLWTGFGYTRDERRHGIKVFWIPIRF